MNDEMIKLFKLFKNSVQEINIENCNQQEYGTVIEYMFKDFIDNNKEFGEKVGLALGEIADEKYKKQNDLLSPEDSLYAKGFPPEEDLQTMKNFHESND